MSANLFQKAEKKKGKARIAIEGPSGAGKTWTSLHTAARLADGGNVAVVDTEQGSASLYADQFDFDVLEIGPPYTPDKYVKAIHGAADAGYAVVVIDSLTHAWAGAGGVLDMVDAAKVRFNNNTQRAWSVGTPAWQSLIDAMLQAPIHVVATMRSKTRYVEETDDRGKVKGYKRAGAEPVARDGVEYEFTITADMDLEHNLVISKSRCHLVPPGTVFRKPSSELADAIHDWLNSGAVPVPPAPDPAEVAKERANALLEAGPREVVVEAMREAGIRSADLHDDDTFHRAQAAVVAAVEAADAPAEETPEEEAA